MYEDTSIINLSQALDLKIAELGEDEGSLYVDAQRKLLAWFDNGQRGDLPEEVRSLPDVAWDEILVPLPVQEEAAEEPLDDFFYSPVDLSPVLIVLERIEEKLHDSALPQISAAETDSADLSPLFTALVDMESRLEEKIARQESESAGSSPPVDLTPVMNALQAAESRLDERISQLGGKVGTSSSPAPVNLAPVLAALQRIETRESEYTGYSGPETVSPASFSPLPVVAGLLIVGLLLAILIFWRTGALLTEQGQAASTGQAGVDAMQQDMQAMRAVVEEVAGNPGLGLTRTSEVAAAQATVTAVQEVLASRLVEVQTAEASLATLEAQASISGGVVVLATRVAAESAALADTATALQMTATAQSQRQSTINIQSTASARQMEQAIATATSLAQSAGATATALVVVEGRPERPTAPPVTVTTPAEVVTVEVLPTPQGEDGQFVITFPPEDAELYVAPWQVEVTGSPWPANGTNYLLLLDGARLTDLRVEGDGTSSNIVYERAFIDGGLIDDFPGMDNLDRRTLDWTTAGQLAPGEYVLQFHRNGQRVGDRPLLTTRTFRIRDDEPPIAVLNITVNLLRRLGPSELSQRDSDSGLAAGSNVSVHILGKTTGFYQDIATDWVLWEATDVPIRRGWAPARFFAFQDGKTLDDVPVTAPPDAINE